MFIIISLLFNSSHLFLVIKMNDYAQDKLNFVSNLNGTNLSDLSMFFTTLPLINCLNFMLKMFIIFMIHNDKLSFL